MPGAPYKPRCKWYICTTDQLSSTLLTLIKSISGMRGTIGGTAGTALTPRDIVELTAAYAEWIKKNTHKRKIVIGRDARLSGEMVSRLVSGTLMACGLDVADAGLSTTPTIEMAVTDNDAAGGIILTASHNPRQWNALKLLNEQGEFISAEAGAELLSIAEAGSIIFEPVENLGSYTVLPNAIEKHIAHILALPQVDVEAIRAANFSVVIDCVNSSGGIALPPLLKALGVNIIHELYCKPDGEFPHNPEPLPEHLEALSNEVKFQQADIGFAVDPDVDRLAIVCEDGSYFGEEYTLVAVADYLLGLNPGRDTVSNLSSSRALRDVTEKHGGRHHYAAVGEVNVVKKMREINAYIGGEGNGGIIFPELHAGRDAMVGIALILSHLAKSGMTTKELRQSYPNYHISKNKIELDDTIDMEILLKEVQNKYHIHQINTDDGVRIDIDREWVHLRKSNTEPIIRIYSESVDSAAAEKLALQIITDIKDIISRD